MLATMTSSIYFKTCSEASDAFYSAFEMNDMQLMKAVWADTDVSCIHPGALPLLGRDDILSSWAQILKNVNKPVIQVELLQQTGNSDLLIQLVIERFAADHHRDSAHSEVVATNVFVKQPTGWRLLQHHATPARSIESVPFDLGDQKYIQ